MKKLTKIEIERSLENLSGWHYNGDNISKKFVFKDHSTAVGFLVRVALFAEKINHHPDWSGVYNEVSIALSTHAAGGVTQKDADFAHEIETYV